MKFLERKEIDTAAWNAAIARSPLENIFCYSWYLDSVAQNWGALATENYDTIMPVAFTRKLGVLQMYQAPFTREYDIFGNEFGWSDALTHLQTKMKGVQFRTAQADVLPDGKIRRHQELELQAAFRENYNTNAKRLIKKAQLQFEFARSEDVKIVHDLFVKYVAHKIETLSASDIGRLEILMNTALKHQFGDIWLVRKDNKTVGAGFFLRDKSRITYLKGACEDKAMKAGAMYGLMNHALGNYQADYRTFDFGGSEIEGVAAFFRKLGAADRTYWEYNINNLPVWFKTLKRIRR